MIKKVCYSNFMGKRENKQAKLKLYRIGAFVTAALAVLCALYFLGIFFFIGYGSKFFMIWAVFAAGFGIWAVVLFRPKLRERIPVWVRKSFVICAAVMLVLFIAVEGMVFGGATAKAEPGADYVIVLGAQWKQSGPSYMLRQRLEKAIEYLEESPDTRVIVSGGKGANEPISEASGMAGYLEDAGIATERILLEDASTSTEENLDFSAAFLEPESDRVVLVTNNYHVFRAVKIAEKKGYANVEGLAAKSHPGILLNNVVREFFAIVKDFAVGNL